jgi:hypothetical protein
MKFALAILAVSLLASCAAPQPGPEPRRPSRELAGRTAGVAQRCVTIRTAEQLRISDSDRHTLLYGSGKTVWANDLGGQCGFRWNDILITEPSTSYYCRGDIVRSVDNLSRIPGPTCILNDFVPYSR